MNNLNDILADAIEAFIPKLRKRNSNVSFEEMTAIIEHINDVTNKPEYLDRSGVLRKYNISDKEFTRLIDKGTKFKPVIPLLSPTRVPGINHKLYSVKDLDDLESKGLIKHKVR